MNNHVFPRPSISVVHQKRFVYMILITDGPALSSTLVVRLTFSYELSPRVLPSRYTRTYHCSVAMETFALRQT